jgi:pimeloyl-ACP methyl ester carboxylesterase
MAAVGANGLEVGYDVSGAGPPLVMLHSASSLGRVDFAAQLPVFSRGFRVYLPDARGHGRTRWDVSGGFDQEMLTDDLEAFVDALGIETFHLLGFSMGAMTALQFAVRRPERVRTLVVAAITPDREPRASVAKRAMDPVRLERDQPNWTAKLRSFHDEVQGRDAWRALLGAIAADVQIQPLLGPAELRRIEAPALIVAGDRDPFAPVDQVWDLSRHVADGRLMIVPDCGHEVPALKPRLFNEACEAFYRSTETSAVARARHGPSTAGLDADDAPVRTEFDHEEAAR